MLCWSIKGFGFVPLVYFNLFFGSFGTFSCSPNFYNDFILLFHGNIFHLFLWNKMIIVFYLLRGNIWCLYCCKLHKCKLSIILIQNFKELFAFSIQITWFIFYLVDIQALREKKLFHLVFNQHNKARAEVISTFRRKNVRLKLRLIFQSTYIIQEVTLSFSPQNFGAM